MQIGLTPKKRQALTGEVEKGQGYAPFLSGLCGFAGVTIVEQPLPHTRDKGKEAAGSDKRAAASRCGLVLIIAWQFYREISSFNN